MSLKNFVTYTSAEFYPGPNMNLVIGPNGSGKSTIVCAICLGLGYSPNVLARATAVGDFVQHGKETAEIEIELAKENGESVVVKRKIKREKNQSTYFLNGCSPSFKGHDIDFLGKPETQGKVQELIASFNIQIDNLWYLILLLVAALIQSISSPGSRCVICATLADPTSPRNSTCRRRARNGGPLGTTLQLPFSGA